MSDLANELMRWLEIDVAEVFEQFLSIATAQSIARGEGDTRFLYIPGERPNPVLLVAHADTKFDAAPGFPAPVRYQNGVYTSGSTTLGIGADDRAGCAQVWELRKLGHSILITSGEEKGCLATHWLIEQNPDVLAALNAHQFMVQFDRRNANEYKCYEVGTDEFRAYVERQTGYSEPDRLRGTDVKFLAQQICGVNLSVGYHDEHTPAETLEFGEWEQTLDIAHTWLSRSDLPKFARNGGG
jgi:hypothetical protein